MVKGQGPHHMPKSLITSAFTLSSSITGWSAGRDDGCTVRSLFARCRLGSWRTLDICMCMPPSSAFGSAWSSSAVPSISSLFSSPRASSSELATDFSFANRCFSVSWRVRVMHRFSRCRLTSCPSSALKPPSFGGPPVADGAALGAPTVAGSSFLTAGRPGPGFGSSCCG
uniref:Uncharacterized protein n=1 Tax=Anopheles atroparvus TaxID=41427 RepID=A0A182J7L5_ANOAO